MLCCTSRCSPRPSALLSDFGSSMLQHENWARTRTGHTGTLEYMAPEAVVPGTDGRLRELTSKADVWSLGILFHLLIFFELPYSQVDDFDLLRTETAGLGSLQAYVHHSPSNVAARGLGRRFDMIHPLLTELLARMLQREPHRRPSCADILAVLDTYVAEHTPPRTMPLGATGSGTRGKSSVRGAHRRRMSRGALLPPGSIGLEAKPQAAPESSRAEVVQVPLALRRSTPVLVAVRTWLTQYLATELAVARFPALVPLRPVAVLAALWAVASKYVSR